MAAFHGNTTRGARDAITVQLEADFAAHDQMPPRLRSAVAGLAWKVPSSQALRFYRDALASSSADPEGYAIRAVQRFEWRRLGEKAAEHEARHRYELPHVAADATFQRPGYEAPR